MPEPAFASPVDLDRWGPYTVRPAPGDERPVYRFGGRITADGSSGFAAEPGRYHLYAGWFCPWAHRVTIVRALAGLTDAVSLAYVDDRRDARGWGFRRGRGPDEVNGFTLLRQAYDATEPDFDGHVSVPTLWDRHTGRIVSNRWDDIGIDLATQFQPWSTTGYHPYPPDKADEIEALDAWVGPAINRGVYRAATDPDAAAAFDAALDRLDGILARSRYLVGDEVTEADARLFVTVVRYQGNLESRPHLWAWARDLLTQPAFASTTDLTSYPPAAAARTGWDAPTDRADLTAATR